MHENYAVKTMKPSWQLLIGSSAFLATIDLDSFYESWQVWFILYRKRRNIGFQADSKTEFQFETESLKLRVTQKPQFVAQRYLKSNKVIVREAAT